jgi:hypothetical protein
MDNVVRLTPSLILEMAEMLTGADYRGKSVRIVTGTDKNGTWIKYDAGSGWTPPLYGLEY